MQGGGAAGNGDGMFGPGFFGNGLLKAFNVGPVGDSAYADGLFNRVCFRTAYQRGMK